jgi:hypothetical protein
MHKNIISNNVSILLARLSAAGKEVVLYPVAEIHYKKKRLKNLARRYLKKTGIPENNRRRPNYEVSKFHFFTSNQSGAIPRKKGENL